ncbi:hypothetical protein [Yoonia sediminilitoris]|uniref:Uncharacterized protein n=1 Tax=Yoonia sediminilitoris TaxID=1286148 RepID=A0A2T6KBX9_9RHOB|nr:hypothetical protein [Yoonia sediminilitoris]PUB12409.1 hypothetical protein C8N45_11048 [Yoonia sediminilitoris]RCW93103.1 hypothetical protein DFP92_11048 [Yoonia sediminilitoris]
MPPPLPLDDAISEVLNVHLTAFVPGGGGAVPDNSVQLVAVNGRRLGLGDRRGADVRLGRPVSALRGVYLDGTARIELWDTTPNAVDAGMEAVQANVMGARASLRSAGFLRLSVADSPPAEHVGALNAWRKTTDLPFLYEYRSHDSDDAQSFIVRVPLRTDLEEEGSPEGVIETVIDDMRRWDDEGAPSLIVRPTGGAQRVHAQGISAMGFLPGGFTGGAVTIERGVAGAPGAPVIHPTLDAFIDAVADGDAAQSQAQVTFPTVAAFLTALGPPGPPFDLGDWDSDAVSDMYVPHQRRFARPVTLRSGRDFLAIRHDAPAFASPAVLYLRVDADHPRSG